MGAEDPQKVILGRINGLYGVKGWVKVYSDTQPRDNIVRYNPWYLRREGGEWQTMALAGGRAHGKGVVVRLAACEDRDSAAAWVGAQIAINQDQLQPLPEDEYYWSELVGLRVVNQDGIDLGIIDHLIETGANDVLVLKGERERLIPYLRGTVVQGIDLPLGEMRVDWDPEF